MRQNTIKASNETSSKPIIAVFFEVAVSNFQKV